MCNHNALPLSLNGDTFNALKSDFDSILRNTLSNMELKGADTAEMNIKLKISLTKDQTRDFEARYDGAMRDIVKPKFEHVVQSVLQIKDKKDGTLSGNYELVWDPDEQKYVMREITDGQTSLFDKDRPIDGQVIVDVDCKVIDDEQPALRGRKVAQLPAPEPEEESGQTPFEWLKQFVDEPMKVMESMGIYTPSAPKTIALSSPLPLRNPRSTALPRSWPTTSTTKLSALPATQRPPALMNPERSPASPSGVMSVRRSSSAWRRTARFSPTVRMKPRMLLTIMATMSPKRRNKLCELRSLLSRS